MQRDTTWFLTNRDVVHAGRSSGRLETTVKVRVFEYE